MKSGEAIKLTVITARALLSIKSSPSLTFPRHTARNNAPSMPCLLSPLPVEHTPEVCYDTEYIQSGYYS